MSRTARASVGGFCYHVLNRGNARAEVFHKDDDYRAFLKLIRDACERRAMRVIGHCLMPNHFHLVLWPRKDGDLSRWMQWLLTAHVRRYHRHYGGSGHVWQGRFKAFPIQQDEHLLSVLRYVERNALRARLVRRAEGWPWGSLAEWGRRVPDSFLHPGPVPRGRDWLAWVNRAQTEADVRAVRHCITRGTPYGEERWVKRTALRLGLESTLRPRGRPRKAPET
ncbi:MAG TPA: transposase [Planctomycetaceae bacterium]|nr:transposase [Planctomycetaceae bacterium]